MLIPSPNRDCLCPTHYSPCPTAVYKALFLSFFSSDSFFFFGLVSLCSPPFFAHFLSAFYHFFFGFSLFAFSAVFGVFYFLIFILLPSAGGILMSPAISVCFPVFIFIQGPGFEWKTTSCPNEHVFPHDQLSPEDVNRSSRWHMNFNVTPDVDWCQMSRNFNKNGCQMSKDAWSQQMSADLVQRTMEWKHLSPGRRSVWQGRIEISVFFWQKLSSNAFCKALLGLKQLAESLLFRYSVG